MRFSLKEDEGQAGLGILLSVVVMLFVIGFLVMIFAIMGGQIEDAGYKETTTAITNITTLTVVNETGAVISGTQGLYNCVPTITSAINQTSKDAINSTDFVANASECKVHFTGDAPTWYNNSLWNVTGSYTYDANTTASQSIHDSTDEISGVTDWYGIIIVITAMVVLILLTVIIISAIRGSGFGAFGGGGTMGKPPKETA